MFYRLINNLNYSPGLVSQIGFYSQRLHKEEFVRRVGLIFTILALTLQAFLVLSPPQPSLASSSNDIIFGGGDKARILNAYRSNVDDLGRTDIQAIFNRFGIGDAELSAASVVTIQSRAENNFHSIGRHSRFSSAIESQVEVPGTSPVYIRPLHAWDSGPYSTYTALYGINNEGKEFWVLTNCGNIVIKDPHPSPLPPSLDIEKSIKSPASNKVLPGDQVTYSIRYRNTGPGAAGFMSVEDLVPKNTSYVSATGPVKSVKNGLVHWDHIDENTNPFGILGVTNWFHEVNLTVKVNEGVANGTEICNFATIDAINGDKETAGPVCVVVDIPEPEPQAAAVCTALNLEKLSRDTFKFTADGAVENGATISAFNFDFGDGNSQSVDNDGSNSAMATHTYSAPGNYQIKATLDSSEGQISSRSCEQSIEIVEPQGEPKITHAKRVSNLTQDIEDANRTVAQAGDKLEYRLITENFGDAAAVDFELPPEDIADILEYSDVIELNDAIFNQDKKVLTWEPVTIEPGGKVEKVFVVQVKDPIPQTPVSASDPGSFDLVMSNAYGNDQVEIKLPPSNNKRIEIVAKELPNTGIGDNLISSVFLIGMSTYFYSRNRLMSKELKMVKKEFNNV